MGLGGACSPAASNIGLCPSLLPLFTEARRRGFLGIYHTAGPWCGEYPGPSGRLTGLRNAQLLCFESKYPQEHLLSKQILDGDVRDVGLTNRDDRLAGTASHLHGNRALVAGRA